MQDTLLSPHWYRISGLHPRLRPHVSVRMQTTRGQPWYVLFNQATGRHHRVNAQAYQMVGRLDGQRSVDEVWQILLEQCGDEAPSQHDVIRILGQMTDAGLIQAEVTPDVRRMVQADDERQRKKRRARLNPLAFRMPLFNPSMLIERLSPLSRYMWSPWTQVAWLVLVLGAAWAVLVDTQAVGAYAHTYFMSPGYLAAAWLIYPIMKALHELGHALTLRRHGCEVPEVGINFFMFVPLPFVDATSSNRLTNRWHRARIAVAGVGVELALAAVAALLWVSIEDGWLRQACFVVMSLGSLSTVLFNGNPLMKLDGYYVLCDSLDLPNLSDRSSRLHLHAWQRLVHRLFGVEAPNEDGGVVAGDRIERIALWLYAPTAWFYRVGVSVLIVTWAADKASLLGMVVALWSFWGLVVQPLSRLINNITSSSGVTAARGRVWLMAGAMAALATGLIGWVPVPASAVMEGVVWLPDEAQVRAPVDGQVDTLWVSGEQTVQKGQPLITLAAPVIQTQLAVLQSQIERSESELNVAFGADAMKAQNAQEALTRDRAALARLQADLDSQVLRAAKSGRFVLSRGADLEGREVNRGDVLAFVLSPEPSVVRVVVPQSDVEDVRRRLQGVSIMLDEQPGRALQGRFLREVPAPSDRLPSAALSDRMGGRVLSDPLDPEGLKTLVPVYVMDVAMAESWPRAGGLAKVRLTLTPQTLAATLAQRWRQLFLKHFSGVPG